MVFSQRLCLRGQGSQRTLQQIISGGDGSAGKDAVIDCVARVAVTFNRVVRESLPEEALFLQKLNSDKDTGRGRGRWRGGAGRDQQGQRHLSGDMLGGGGWQGLCDHQFKFCFNSVETS